jgi:cysteine-rich repeat protein
MSRLRFASLLLLAATGCSNTTHVNLLDPPLDAIPGDDAGSGGVGSAGAGGASGAAPVGPRCGDGQVAGDEACDDGNTRIGDGCESDCTPSFVLDGPVEWGEPPISVDEGAIESDTTVRLFAERLGFVLPGSVSFDVHVPGTYQQFPAQAGQLPAGSRVNSYYVHHDVVDTVTHAALTISVTFPTDVLAIVTSDGNLSATDEMLGRPGVSYPTSLAQRGLDGDQDRVVLDVDRRTVSATLTVGTAVDSLRILTASAPEDRILVAAGSAALVPPPPALPEGAAEGAVAWLFLEGSRTVGPDVTSDLREPGSYDSEAALQPAPMVADEAALTYLLHFDPVGQPEIEATVSGSVTFPGQILGVMVTSGRLFASDGFGSPTTLYPAAEDTTRGAELGSDSLWVSRDRRSVIFSFVNQVNIDQIRFVTRAP